MTVPTSTMWILDGADTEGGLTFRLRPGAIKTIGRAPGADFIVDAPLVSRVHCRLTAFDDRIEVTDLTSTNGTYVNGKAAGTATLRNGDHLRVGRIELTLRAGSA